MNSSDKEPELTHSGANSPCEFTVNFGRTEKGTDICGPGVQLSCRIVRE
ncbi:MULTISPECIES: hypothetical protein [Spirosoma]|uniref:Uncharacterized protein n=1 Tax=Spirosoma liriopis TaxID=2937440 RepID=A0ABT0HPU0_9BACT|nr:MULTISPECIES: hypothetical protein [Spirosoma]MCK8494186.1 hypothetical protein [Spirosoma liriopis]UHG89200.1 hypothetical protein LQ777_13195 [Spirosoma oryzicola]